MKKLTALLLALVPATAWAHPGHGATDPTTARHVVIVLAAAIVASVAIGASAWAKSTSRHRD